MKYNLQETLPIIEKTSGQKLKSNESMLDRLVDLWVQLDDEEDAHDKPLGLAVKPMSDKDLRELFKNKLLKNGDIRVVKLGEQIIGMAIVSTTEFEKCYYISAVIIDKAHRSKGYGKMLMQNIFDSKPGERPMLGVSCGNTGGLSLYKSLGFKPVSMVMLR